MSTNKKEETTFSRRKFLKTGAIAGGAAVIGLAVGIPALSNTLGKSVKKGNYSMVRLANASATTPQTAVDGSTITKYVDPVPTFVGARVNAYDHPNLTIDAQETQQKILPAAFYSPLSGDFKNGTYVWGYAVNNGLSTAGPLYPAFTIEAKRNTPVKVTYSSSLDNATSKLAPYITIDQSIHWADPLNERNPNATPGVQPEGPLTPYSGPIPVVTHLHGGEVPSTSDGGPDAWFTKGYAYRGPAWTAGTTQYYNYPNGQEPTTLFYHDHVLGATRTNLYSGLVGFYFIRDSYDTGIAGKGLNLPAGPYEIELAIQDKMLDTNGQLLFPDGTGDMQNWQVTPNAQTDGAGFNGAPPNPTVHPFWEPEFFGDIILVNGKSWPYLNVEPRRYRFRMVNGANARFFNLAIPGAKIYQIGTDGGLLDKPVKVDTLLFAPGERADIIVDFAGTEGTEITMTNDAVTPYPGGGAGPGGDLPGAPHSTAFLNTVGQIMMFKVGTTVTGGKDTSFDPSKAGATLRSQGPPNQPQPLPIVRFTDGAGGLASGVKIDKYRQIVLLEVASANGPLGVTVNNTRFEGVDFSNHPISGYKLVDGRYLSETPKVGSTEQWDIINLTGDAHPMHLHLTQFQLLNRQGFNNNIDPVTDQALPGGYRYLYNSQFSSGVFEPFNGPPNDYFTPNDAGALGGNPDVTPFLTPGIIAPSPEEAGWKDVIKVLPDQVTRIVVRFAPQKYALNAVRAGQNKFPFDPTVGPGYVWHCHIVDHEDNEMMRPYTPI